MSRDTNMQISLKTVCFGVTIATGGAGDGRAAGRRKSIPDMADAVGEAVTLSSLAGDLGAMLPDLLCLCRHGRIMDINQAGLRLLQVETRAAILDRPFADVVHHDYAMLVTDGLDALTEDPDGVPLMLVTARGERREVHLLARALESPSGTGWIALHGRDVTERTRAVEGLLASEARFRQLVDRSLSLLCLLRDGYITYINGAGRDLLGVARAGALRGRPLSDLLHPDYTGILDLGLEALTRETDLLPIRLLTCHGQAVDVEARVVALGTGPGGTMMLEARDITERKRAAQALRDREQRLQGILDSVSEAVITTDDQGLIQSFNPAARDLFGYTAAEVLGRDIAMLMPDRLARDHGAHMARMRDDGGDGRVLGRSRELEGRRKDGSDMPIELAISRLRTAHGVLITGIIRDITERRQREAAARRQKADLEKMVEQRTREVRQLGRHTELILRSAGEGIVGLNAIGHVIFANPVAERLLRASPDGLRGRSLDSIMRTRETGAPPEAVAAIIAGRGQETHGETTLLALDDSPVAAEYAAAPMTDEGRRLGAVVMVRDIAQRKEAEGRLRLAYTVFDTAAEAIVVCGTDGLISMVNPAFTGITGHAESEALGRPLLPMLFDTPARRDAMMTAVSQQTGKWAGEFWHRRSDGRQVALRVVASAVRGDAECQGAGTETVALVVSDITQRKRDEERIHHQANHDALTGLANRALFMETLAGTVTGSRSGDGAGTGRDGGGGGVALMFIDLDGFKAVNDTLGHDAGDLLLKGAARRIERAAREGDMVARLGGDEFTVILPGVATPETARHIARRILAAISAPYSLAGHPARISGSIGLALLEDSDADAEALLRRADAAMYAAKQGGKGTIRLGGGRTSPSGPLAGRDADADADAAPSASFARRRNESMVG